MNRCLGNIVYNKNSHNIYFVHKRICYDCFLIAPLNVSCILTKCYQVDHQAEKKFRKLSGSLFNFLKILGKLVKCDYFSVILHHSSICKADLT